MNQGYFHHHHALHRAHRHAHALRDFYRRERREIHRLFDRLLNLSFPALVLLAYAIGWAFAAGSR